MARTPRKRQPAATTVVVPRNAGTGRRPRAEWTEEEEAYAQRLIDDFRNGRTPSLRNGSYLSGHLAGILGRPASTIRLHFGALGKRGFRKLLTPTPAEAQEVADLRTAFLDARALPGKEVQMARKDDAWRAATAFHSANVAVWKAAEGDAAALQLLRDGRREHALGVSTRKLCMNRIHKWKRKSTKILLKK